MRIDIITVLPEMLEGFVNESILARAQKKGLAEIHLHNLRDYSTDKWRRVDDYPYGGFAGMVMQCEPIAAASCSTWVSSGIMRERRSMMSCHRPKSTGELRRTIHRRNMHTLLHADAAFLGTTRLAP